MDTNRISATLSTPDQLAVLSEIDSIRQKLPFLIDLSARERAAMAKLGDKSQAFVRKAVEICRQHPELFAAGFVEEMRKDAELIESLAPIRTAVESLRKQIDDTATQVGAEAYAAARTAYTVTKTPFAKAALREASGDLAKRFGRKTKTAASAEPAPSSPPAASVTTTA